MAELCCSVQECVLDRRTPVAGGRAIKTIVNTSRKPVRIALPRGKTLHLGPGGRGQVHDDALERPALRKLIESGEIALLDDAAQPGEHHADADRKSGPGPRSEGGRAPAKGLARKGDR